MWGEARDNLEGCPGEKGHRPVTVIFVAVVATTTIHQSQHVVREVLVLV